MRILSREEARALQKEWGIDENEVVITFVSRAKPAPPQESAPNDDPEEKEDDA